MSSMVFFPPLQSRTTFSVPADASSVTVALRVSLTPDSLENVRSNGTVVEVWTNMPTSSNRDPGWSAQAFQERTTPPDKSFRLSPEGDEEDDEHEFIAHFVLPNTAHATYAFTYRLAFPSGDFYWLGMPRDNGVLEVRHSAGPFSERGTWITTADSRRVFSGSYAATDEVVAGAIKLPCTFWELDGTTAPRRPAHQLVPHPTRTLIALPTPEPTALYRPSPLILHCPLAGTCLSVSTSGRVTFHTGGDRTATLERWTFDPHSPTDAQRLREQVTGSGAPPPRVLVLGGPGNPSVLTFAPAVVHGGATSVAVIPLVAERNSIALPAASFAFALAQEGGDAQGDTVALFCARTRQAMFVDMASDEPTEVTIYAGRSGGDFVVCPAHQMSPSSVEQRATWLIAVPSLPTPPEIVEPQGNEERVKEVSGLGNPHAQLQSMWQPSVWAHPFVLLACMVHAFFGRVLRVLWWASGASMLSGTFAPHASAARDATWESNHPADEADKRSSTARTDVVLEPARFHGAYPPRQESAPTGTRAFRWTVPPRPTRTKLTFLVRAPSPGSDQPGVRHLRVLLAGKEVLPVVSEIGEGTTLFELVGDEGEDVERVLEIGLCARMGRDVDDVFI